MHKLIHVLVWTITLTALTEANGEFVSYVANIETSAGNPVTDLLIMEEDSDGLVHASVLRHTLFGSKSPRFSELESHPPSVYASQLNGAQNGLSGAEARGGGMAGYDSLNLGAGVRGVT